MGLMTGITSADLTAAEFIQPCLQIRARLAAEVSGGSFYEAQQTYKATFSRYKGKDDWANATAILQACDLV
jgi:hypothetical protein